MATPQSPLPATALDHDQITVGSSAVSLGDPPARAKRTVIRTLGQPINWRDDGQDPTGTTGMALLADEIVVLDADPNRIKLIRAADATGDADVRVAFYA